MKNKGLDSNDKRKTLISKMSYQGFGYIVDSCPINQSTFNESASRLNCGVDENGRSQYICVPNKNMSATVEFCYNKTVVGLYEKGHCLIELNDGFLDQVGCSEFRKGCPQDPYFGSDLYKYPACQDINQRERCFNADPACPNVTSSTISFVREESTNSIISTGISNTTPYFNDTGNIPENVDSIPPGIIALIIVGIVIIAVIIPAVITICKKRRAKQTHEFPKDLEESVALLPKENHCCRYQGDYSLWKTGSPDSGESETFIPKDNKINKDTLDVERDLRQYLGDYSVWKTKISDTFIKLSSDAKAVLFCFIYSDNGAPDFTDKNTMFLLNVTRRKTFDKHDDLTQKKAQQILNKLKSSRFLNENQEGVHISEDTEDEIVYLIVERSPLHNDFNLFLFSFNITKRYFRSQGYTRKRGEKCIISPASVLDYIIIRRLQMDIVNHVTMEDSRIHNEVFQILNIPYNILKQDKKERENFVEDLKLRGQPLHYKSRYQNHVQWLSRYWRPDIVRSCIGLYPHCDIYIINNMAYRISTKYHDYTDRVRSMLYCLLFTEEYIADVKNDSCKILLKKIRERYFKELAMSVDDNETHLPKDLTQTQNGVISFTSEQIRHEVMYAFITECLTEDSDLEFFLTTASRDVISEYCRSWKYKRENDERCLYIPDRPSKMYDLFIDKLQMDIVKHCTVSDRSIHSRISERLSVPREILGWDNKARQRYVEYARRGTKTVHHARGMIVGCAGAGKTTLLKRLLRSSEENILSVTPTKELEVHDEKFEICEETNSLKVRSLEKTHTGDKTSEENPRKTLTFFDFGGQCTYYACHQIYLTRRAFYIVVVDASKQLDDVVDIKVCDQTKSVFFGWTYGDYFVFWIKSIHTYCGIETEQDHRPDVVIVATHWEDGQRIYKSEEEFIEVLQSKIPRNSHLLQYIREDYCFFIQFPVTPLDDLEKCIVDIVRNKRWKEKIPKEWAFFKIEIKQKKNTMKILSESDIASGINENGEAGSDNNIQGQNTKKDMLRFYHDAGKVLYFNEKGLDKLVIIDMQWFVDAFKNIITDKLHMKGIPGSRENWDDYYETGNLKDQVLTEIWKQKDVLQDQIAKNESKDTKDDNLDGTDPEFPDDVFFKPGISEHRDNPKRDPLNDPRDFLHYKTSILNFMQRLGLVAIGEKTHYIPCMNRKIFDEETLNIIRESKVKTSILIFQFQFLPYFFFFRLVVACMQIKDWKVLKSQEKPCLYRNAALFSSGDHHIVIAATPTSIQLQVYQQKPECSLEVHKTIQIQSTTEEILKEITTTFHRRIEFVKGFSCKKENEQSITMEIDGHFIPEQDIVRGDKVLCPLHQVVDHHSVNMNKLTKYWNI